MDDRREIGLLLLGVFLALYFGGGLLGLGERKFGYTDEYSDTETEVDGQTALAVALTFPVAAAICGARRWLREGSFLRHVGFGALVLVFSVAFMIAMSVAIQTMVSAAGCAKERRPPLRAND